MRAVEGVLGRGRAVRTAPFGASPRRIGAAPRKLLVLRGPASRTPDFITVYTPGLQRRIDILRFEEDMQA